MDKNKIKNILISMKTPENEDLIEKLLAKIDSIEESSLQEAVKQIGGTEESLRKYFEKKLSEHQHSTKHIPINKLFSYGISDDCIHLHLPLDLHQMLEQKGISGTIDTVNRYLLDAIDRIKELKDNGFYKFDNIKSIYMISPVLINKELKFLNQLDFKTNSYTKKQLKNESFINGNPEAQLATHLFGNNTMVGSAKISIDAIKTKEWQDKKKRVIKEYEEKGITLDEDENKNIGIDD